MITAGDIEFEPPSKKIAMLTSSIGMMYSGDLSLHAEIAQDLIADIQERIHAAPEVWLKVRDVANLYARHWAEARFRRAEIEVLAPLGLARTTFLEQATRLEPKFIDKIVDAMGAQRVPSIEVIIAGVDLRFGTLCPSIYHVADGYMMCADQTAFAAIGTGARHVESQFMLAKYSGDVPNGEALLLAYSAKRDAEVAPGVGTETDIVAIGAGVGRSLELANPIKTKIETEYKKIRAKDEMVRQKGRAEVSRFLEELSKNSPQGQQSPVMPPATLINSQPGTTNT
jgi:hypothetical protein